MVLEGEPRVDFLGDLVRVVLVRPLLVVEAPEVGGVHDFLVDRDLERALELKTANARQNLPVELRLETVNAVDREIVLENETADRAERRAGHVFVLREIRFRIVGGRVGALIRVADGKRRHLRGR